MTDLSPETVGKLVALVRRMAIGQGPNGEKVYPSASSQDDYREARALVAELPEPVDPDLVEARELVASAVEYGRRSTFPATPSPADFRSGAADDGMLITQTLAAIKRGRALAAGERSC